MLKIWHIFVNNNKNVKDNFMFMKFKREISINILLFTHVKVILKITKSNNFFVHLHKIFYDILDVKLTGNLIFKLILLIQCRLWHSKLKFSLSICIIPLRNPPQSGFSKRQFFYLTYKNSFDYTYPNLDKIKRR